MHTHLIRAGLRAARRLALLAGVALLLAGCASRPDLARLYEGLNGNPEQPPVIVIHGLMGSTLVEAESGREFWPGSLGTLTFSNYSDLAQMSDEDREGEGLVPGRLFASVAGVDFYGEMVQALEKVGRFHPGVPGEPAGAERRHYYVMLYDWRKDNLLAVRKLHELIEQIRIDYGDPNLRVDIIAHSNGGLIANYYLRYGPRDVLEETAPATWDEGDKRIRRLVMLGTPVLGATTSLERLVHGTRMAVRTVPAEVMVTFSTPFQTLPHPLVRPILDTKGQAIELDIYDVEVWKRHRWGVFAPEVMARVKNSMPTPEAGAKALSTVQETFARNLRRGWQMHWALSAPPPPSAVEVAVFGGDCELTPSRAVQLVDGDGSQLVFRPGQVDPKPLPGAPNPPRSKVDFERLMYAPGDGLVTRSSQVGRPPSSDALRMARFHPLPIAQSFFLCESHGRLTHNAYFQNNLLSFLLGR